MANFIIRSNVYWIVLLIGVSLIKVKGSTVVRPGVLVKNKSPILPEVENFARLEAKLENITDAANLYTILESDRENVIKSLLRIPEVQSIIDECKKFHVPIVCKTSLYRRTDGSCNNFKHPDWGKAVTEQRRLLPPNYEGSNGFRKSVTGKELPPCRSISLSMKNLSNPSTLVSALFTFFGQFLAHDITLTPGMTEDGKVPPCCDPSKKKDPFCATFDISHDDPFYSRYNVTCRSISRAAPYPKCNFEKRGVINKKSSFIDASNIYDNKEEHLKTLRANDGTGQLRSQDSKFGKLLPKNHDNKTLFCPVAAIERCFDGGDDRINQHTMLISLQTIFHRLHNNVARSLHQLNPHWGDDNIFEESRRIVIALLQYVTYAEYLPLLIGSDNMETYDLYPDFQRGSVYSEEVDPSILVEFSGAAFRAHSMVPLFVSGSMPRLKFQNTYSNLRLIHRGWLDHLLAGASEVPSEMNDEFQTEAISNNVFKLPVEPYGGDLTAVDIQRGRDLGLPSYTQMVEFCFDGLKIRDFSHLRNLGLMTEKNVRELRNIYENVCDIDLLVGILREIQDARSVFGPTATCIASVQFHRIKFGDSFFFTHLNGRNNFTAGQMESLKAYSLARIICETTQVEKVRRSPFMINSTNNPMVLCETFSPMQLIPWKDESL